MITYTSLISAYVTGEPAEQTLQLFETMRSKWLVPVVVTYSLLINACAEEEGRINERRIGG